MPKVSVIIPVYGVEKYIERCARSLFDQTLDDIEFIFVDDSTPDKSIEILHKVLNDYPNRNSQVQILHHEVNKGLPMARLTGLKVAKGEYVAHCDSDDWVDTDMYRAMYEKAIETDSDVIICDYCKTNGNDKATTKIGCHSNENNEFITNCIKQIDSWAVWNKLCARYLYDDITYPVYAMGEDMVITMQILLKCKSLAYIPKTFYNYFINTDSITNKPTKERCLRNYTQIKRNVDIIFKVITSKAIESIPVSAAVCLKYNVMTMLLPIVWDKEFYKIWKDSYPGFFTELFFGKGVPSIYKLKCLLTLLHLYPRKRDRIY